MKSSVIWKAGMEFDGVAEGHTVPMDAKRPIGKSSAATPKELVAMGLGGCTAMDVIALLKKHKQPPSAFRIEIEIQPSTSGNPVVFEKAELSFMVEGEVTPETLLEAVQLSQTKYCGVSAMLAKAFPIEYRVYLNSQEIGSGSANFETNQQKENL
jgi:putative redox protein